MLQTPGKNRETAHSRRGMCLLGERAARGQHKNWKFTLKKQFLIKLLKYSVIKSLKYQQYDLEQVDMK